VEALNFSTTQIPQNIGYMVAKGFTVIADINKAKITAKTER